MGNKKNRAKKNKRLANNWRKIIKTRKGKKCIPAIPKKFEKLEQPKIQNDSRSDVNHEYETYFTGDENLILGTHSDSNNTLGQNIAAANQVKNGKNSTRCSYDCKEHTEANNDNIDRINLNTNEENITDSRDLQLQGNGLITKPPHRRMQNKGQSYYVLQKFEPDQHTRIIRGDFHQGDKIFNKVSRNKQCMAISVVVLCAFKINDNPATWKTADINDILITGDTLYHISYKKMKRERKTPQSAHLLASEVYPIIKIGRKYYGLNGKDVAVEKDVLNLNNLITSLNRFFNVYQCGVFTHNTYSFAIMRNSDSFFLFNSLAMSYAGELMTQDDRQSSACVMEMFSTTCLSNHLLVACNRKMRVSDVPECDPSLLFSLIHLNVEKQAFGTDISKRRQVHRDFSNAKRKRGDDDKPMSKSNGDVEEQPILNNAYPRPAISSNQVKNGKNSTRCSYDCEEHTEANNDNIDRINLNTNEVLIGCGLSNIGNSCFFNACIQAYFHLPIVNVHLQNTMAICCESGCVVCNIIALFKDTHSQHNSIAKDPSNLYRALRYRNEDVLNGKQQDAHEFWLRLMEAIKNERNCSSTLFLHEVIITVICESCNNISQTEQEASGHIIEVRGRLTIQQALDDYFAQEIIESYICDMCVSNTQAKKKYSLKSVPNVLYLLLNRFEHRNKIEDNIRINEQLMLSDEAKHINYNLVSIVNHVGTSIDSGHYTTIACCSNHSFYEFDDSRVNSIDSINGCNTYILMYELSDKTKINNHVNLDTDCNSECGASRERIDNKIASAEESTENFQEETETSDVQNQQLRDEYDDFGCDANIQCSDNVKLSGRRIVDIGFLFEQMRDLNRHAEECDSRMDFIKETKLGLRSILYFECSICGGVYKVKTSYKNKDSMDVNKAATLGITSIGSGFYHLEEVCAHLDIPCISSSTFDIQNKKIQKDWAKLAKHHTEQALKEEIALAKARDDVDSAGNVLMPVVCDGSWGKRSYGKGFSSLSGCAAIIGFHTKKVLYFDTKNKYCDICTKSYAKFCPPNDHHCNINYVGPSSGMETQIIVEGFQACERMGVRFNKIISDGDSSAFKEISERCVYQNPELFIEKLECTNHLFKNFRSKLIALCADTKFNKAGRSLLDPSIGEKIGKGIRMAAKHWRNSNLSQIEKLQNLEKDCLNAPYHYFGNHDNCNKYFCKKTTTAESNAIIDVLKSFNLFYEIVNYCNIYFASNVRSPIEDQTNNSAEELNNVIAKYLGGKRINYSLAGSYTGRVSAAVVQFNSKGHAGSQFHNSYYMDSSNSCLEMENSRIRHYAKNEATRQSKPRKRATNDKTVKDYGECHKPDMCEDSFEIAKNVELAKFDSNRLNRDTILKKTYGQRHNNHWFEVRKKLINANYFGRIINARNPYSFSKLVEEILYFPAELGNTQEVRHQRLYELEGLRMFGLVHKDFELEQCGIFIDETLGYLGASPLRLYGPDSIVDVRCPIKGFKKTVKEAVLKKLIPFKYENGQLRINEKHTWYIELQEQLHISGRNKAYLVVWLGSEYFIESVTVNHAFWNNKIQDKIEFFFKAFIKELADPRRKRKMPLRKYDPENKTFI